jgi:hypothetical protein
VKYSLCNSRAGGELISDWAQLSETACKFCDWVQLFELWLAIFFFFFVIWTTLFEDSIVGIATGNGLDD